MDYPINLKELVSNCYNQNTTLSISRDQSRFCIQLVRNPNPFHLCNFEKGVKFSMRTDLLSYQINQTINNFNYSTFDNICFFCDPAVDKNKCSNIQESNNIYLNLESPNYFTIIPVGKIIRDVTNFSICYNSGSRASSANSSYIQLNKMEICYVAINSGFCKPLEDQTGISKAVIKIGFTHSQIFDLDTEKRTYTFEKLEIGGLTAHKICFDINVPVFTFLGVNTFEIAEAAITFEINDVASTFYDNTFLTHIDQYFGLFSISTAKMLESQIETDFLGKDDTLVQQFIDSIANTGITKIITKFIIQIPSVSVEEVFLFEKQIPVDKFYQNMHTVFMCTESSIDFDKCMDYLNQLLQIQMNQIYSIQEVYFYKGDQVEHILAEPMSRIIVSCIQSVELTFVSTSIQIALEQSKYKASCPNIPGFQGYINLEYRHPNQTQDVVFNQQLFFSFNLRGIEFKCEKNCESLYYQFLRNDLYLSIYEQDGTLFDTLYLSQIYNLNYAALNVISGGYIGLGLAVSLGFGVYIIFFKKSKPDRQKKTSKKQVKVDEIEEM